MQKRAARFATSASLSLWTFSFDFKTVFFCVSTLCVFVINDRWNRPFCSININISINKHAPGGVNVLFKEKSECT